MTNPEANRTYSVAQVLKYVLLTFLGRYRTEYCLLIVISSMMSGMTGIIHPFLIKAIFDGIIGKDGMGHVAGLIVLYLSLGIVINGVDSLVAIWDKSLQLRITKRACSDLVCAYYQKDYGGVLKHGYGYFTTRAYGDIRDGLIPLLVAIRAVANQGLLLVALLSALAYLCWRAFAVLVVLVPLSGGISVVLSRQIKALAAREREEEGSFVSTLTKALGAFRMVRSFDLVPQAARVVARSLESFVRVNYKRFRATRILQSLSDLSITIADFLSLLVGALFVMKGTLTFGAYLAFINSFWKAVNTLTQILKGLPDLYSYMASTKRIDDFVMTPSRKYYNCGSHLSVRNLKFGYGGDCVLDGVYLSIRDGERVVLVGRNGCGKTTLLNILSGYLAPTCGDVDLPRVISSLTLPISFPPVAVNDLVKNRDIRVALQLESEKILTAIADELSAGQQQKVALALALSREADLYLLDEPLANLDVESSEIAIRLILERTKGRSLIVVMHGGDRYHNLFDRVISMDRARVPYYEERDTSVVEI